MPQTDLSAVGLEDLLAKEWLATNGLGGYASSSIAGLHTRKYHGFLVAPLTPPHRRMVLLSRVEESFFLAGGRYSLCCNEYPDTIHPRGFEYLRAFNHDPFPRWGYQGDGWTIEKSLRLLRGHNTVVLCYSLLGGGQSIDFELRPLFAMRGIHQLMYQWNGKRDLEDKARRHHHILATQKTPEAFFAHDGEFEVQPYWYLNTIYRRETERGYGGLEDLWSPGIIRTKLNPGQSLHFVCSTDPIDFATAVIEAERQYVKPVRAIAPTISPTSDAASGSPIKLQVKEQAGAPSLVTVAPSQSSDPALEALLRAADQFVVTDKQGQAGIMATYPWPSPSVRSALSALTGLFLVPGRYVEARSLITRLFSHLRDGLIPSDFPEDGSAPLYHSADTALWLIKACDDYLRYSGDEETVVRRWLEPAVSILNAYRRGTDLGITVDAHGLIESKCPGLGTTWMDANLNGWVVTPRQGKPVELNALWYNALCTVAGWCERAGRTNPAEDLRTQARQTKTAFNATFWNETGNCCFDVVDTHGRDPSIRPNQLLAMTLPNPVLATEFHGQVLAKVKEHLLTPVGVRTLAPSDPAFQGHYGGHVASRDRAYHNGTAYPSLLGWYARALIRVEGRTASTSDTIRKMLAPCLVRLVETGQVCELFDGNAPHAPGGAFASARAVGELLRCYVEDVMAMEPARDNPAPTESPTPRVPQAV